MCRPDRADSGHAAEDERDDVEDGRRRHADEADQRLRGAPPEKNREETGRDHCVTRRAEGGSTPEGRAASQGGDKGARRWQPRVS